MTARTDLLFVYGTLMSMASGALGQGERLRLRREGRILGKAMAAGLMVDLGNYPGLVEPRRWSPAAVGRSTVVHGELLALTDPEQTFSWLDRYEGIVPGGRACEYRRDVIDAVLTSAPLRRREANAYIFQGGMGRARIVPGGRWTTGGD
ncbi:MAG: gamma-glutamylcyclotransferase [Hyphomicrobiaceae bacterium]|nr:gamma-glutamylcyclotransferase [Hyphomicrobiaceae bacterium]